MKAILITLLVLTIVGFAWVLINEHVDLKSDYRTANQDSAHLAPDPKTTHEAIIQAYSARAFNWRGIFATHTWIATKAKDADHYTVYQVVGWQLYRNLPAVAIRQDIPDRYWFNQRPNIILDLRGQKAEALISQIDQAAKSYPYPNRYDLWPGPNSNTFIAYIGRKVPMLGLVLPSNAIGKDYLPAFDFFARAPSGTGYQFSVLGLFGILIAKKEGIEINLLGLVYGVKFEPFALLLPAIGAVF